MIFVFNVSMSQQTLSLVSQLFLSDSLDTSNNVCLDLHKCCYSIYNNLVIDMLFYFLFFRESHGYNLEGTPSEKHRKERLYQEGQKT